jgi:hypothetical protein
MAYEGLNEGLGSIEPQQECIDFDLQIALKQPERVAQRGTGKPVEWKYFEKRGVIFYVTEEGNFKSVPVGNNGYYCKQGIKSEYDLILLPEPKPFEGVEGKYYWAKFHENQTGIIMSFSGGVSFGNLITVML